MKILYENQDGTVCVISPIITEHGLDALAKKDVPFGFPYWIVDDSALPESREYRAAWRIDHEQMGDPHGHGHEASTFEEVVNAED